MEENTMVFSSSKGKVNHITSASIYRNDFKIPGDKVESYKGR